METFRFLLATTFYPPYHLGGDAVHVQYLAEALASRGHEVHVEFSPAAYRLKRRGSPGPMPRDNGVRVHAIPSPLGRAQPVSAHVLGRSGTVTRFHERLSREVRPDVVHLHNISLLGLGVVKRPPGAVMLYTAHDYWARCPRSDLLKFGKEPCVTPSCVTCALVSRRPPQLWRYGSAWRGLPGVDWAIAPSRYMAGAIESSLGCPVVPIPNFAPDPNPEGTVSPPGDYYLFVGVLEPHKGLLEIARAAAGPSGLRVKVVGSGSLARHLADLQRNGAARIELEGWVTRERLTELYRGARALLLPSVWPENAPLVAVEALAMGTPLLTSTRGGLQEVLYGGATGRSFEPNAEGLLTSVDAFEREGLPLDLRCGARSAYEANHRTESYIERYIRLVQTRGPAVTSSVGAGVPTPHVSETARAGSSGGFP